MPLTPLMTAGLESALNRLLWQNSALKPARQRLNNKVLSITIAEFSKPLTLVFSESQVDVLGAWEGDTDCQIITRLGVLPELRNRKQLTTLIRRGDLEVTGDLQVVQHFVSLVDSAEFSLDELLAPYVGDIIATGIGKALRKGACVLKAAFLHQQNYLAEAITQEWKLAPGRLEVTWVCDEISALADDMDTLEKRLRRLEEA